MARTQQQGPVGRLFVSETPDLTGRGSMALDTQSRLVTVVVNGVEYQPTVHEATLRNASAWFSKELDRLAGDRLLCPFGDISTFKYFAKFAYSGILKDDVPRDSPPRKNLKFEIAIAYKTLCDAWLLGQDLGALEFQNECLRTWSLKRYADYKEGVRHKAILEIGHVWELTGPASKLRKFLIDSYANMDVGQLMRVDAKHWPKDFVIELLKAYAEKHDDGSSSGEREYFRTRDLKPFKAELIPVVTIDEVDDDAAMIDAEQQIPAPQQARPSVVNRPFRPAPRQQMPIRSPEHERQTPQPSWLAQSRRMFPGESRSPTPARTAHGNVRPMTNALRQTVERTPSLEL